MLSTAPFNSILRIIYQRLKVNGLRRADLVRIQCSLNKFGQIHEIETNSEGGKSSFKHSAAFLAIADWR